MPDRTPTLKRQNAKPKTVSQHAMDFARTGLNWGLGGLHTFASVTNTPSRIGWGSINLLTGGERGMGNLNPLDDTGGVQAGHVVGERFLGLAPNDPTKWEQRDFAEGGLDILGDPTTYAYGVGLMKRGAKFVSDASGLTKATKAATKAVSASPVGDQLRSLRSKFDYRTGGITHRDIQPEMVARTRQLEELNRRDDLLITQMARQQEAERIRLGMPEREWNDRFRMAAENVAPQMDSLGHASRLKTINDLLYRRSLEQGTGLGAQLDDIIGYAPRRLPEAFKRNLEDYASASGFLTGKGPSDVSRLDLFKGFHEGSTGINKLFSDDTVRQLSTSPHLTPTQASNFIESHIGTKYGALIDREIKDQVGNVIGNRHRDLADYIVRHPRVVQNQGLFTNTPLADQRMYMRTRNAQDTAADVVYNSIGKTMGNIPEGKSIEAFLVEQGFDVATGLNQIASRTGRSLDDVRAMQIPHDVANQLSTLTPNYRGPSLPDDNWIAARNIGRARKAMMLMFPKSRMRDAMGGVVQNVLHDTSWNPLGLMKGYGDANRILSGRLVKHDYSKNPDIQNWFRLQGLDINNPAHNTPANQTEALRQLASVDLPQEHYGILGDLAPDKAAYTLDDLTRNVPGQTESTLTQRAFVDPLMALMGRGTQWKNPTRVRGWQKKNEMGTVDSLDATTFAPVRASELVSGESDAMNRLAPYLTRLRRGESADEAGRAVNRSQVDYNPEKFTEFERKFVRPLMPFYSFNSRMLANTAGQLANPASRTALLTKVGHKAGGNDPTLPDYVSDSAQIPLGTLPDGTKRNITGFGLMHEPSTTLLGNALAGKGRDVGYQILAAGAPEATLPVEYVTGQKFFMRGEPLTNLDGGSGRLIRNIRQTMGIDETPENGGPRSEYDYPGRKWVDSAINLVTPLQLLMNQARTATDPRKPAIVKAANILSGVNVVDTSPDAQQRQISKRVDQALYDIDGVRKFERPYMTAEQLENLRISNPKAYAQYMALQGLRSEIRSASTPKKSPKQDRSRHTKTATIRKR